MRGNVDRQPADNQRGETVSVDGLEMYYESHGVGRPLVLLHGAMSTIETSFGATIPLLAPTRRIIAVEQQGHGRTADAERPLSYRQMAKDTARLVQKLNIAHADFFGYSMGAGIALELAIQYPQLVRRLHVQRLDVQADEVVAVRHPADLREVLRCVRCARIEQRDLVPARAQRRREVAERQQRRPHRLGSGRIDQEHARHRSSL